jgi:glucosylceramidase
MRKRGLALIALLSVSSLGCADSPEGRSAEPTEETAAIYSSATVVQTSRGGDKLTEIARLEFSRETGTEARGIALDPTIEYQTILGFGGSFTESTAYVLTQLSKEKREEVIEAYFGPSGADYTLTRTHINSSDFSLGNYAYAMVPGDFELEHFTIEEDLDDIVPLIRDAQAVSESGFEIIASPWTAPPWMKDNNDWNDGSLLPDLYPTWALYFSKYIRAYEEQGIPIWGVTIENEPLGNGGQWESMRFTPESMRDFLRDHLGPRFEEDGIDARILVYDQNRDHLEEWADVILGDPEAAKYAWGTAVHWYSSTYDWYPKALETVQQRFPDGQILHTEGTIDAEIPVWRDDDWYWRKEATDWGYDWAPDEDKHLHPKYAPTFRYARDIIGGLNSWLVGWIDWNMVLDTAGGPNHAENWCIAPVIAKPETDEVYYTPLYYVLAHFSKYIRPGAVRVGLTGSCLSPECLPDELMATAFRNLDGTIVVAILNQSDAPVDYALTLGGRQVEVSIAASAVQTVVVE